LDSLTRFAAAKPEKKKDYRWEEKEKELSE